jgi:hypothetical protein
MDPNIQVHFRHSSHSHFLDTGHWPLSAVTVLLESRCQQGKYEGTNGLINYPHLFDVLLQFKNDLVSSQSIYVPVRSGQYDIFPNIQSLAKAKTKNIIKIQLLFSEPSVKNPARN